MNELVFIKKNTQHTKIKPKPKPTVICVNCSYVCVSVPNIVHNYSAHCSMQHKTVLTIYPLIHQTTIIAQMLSVAGPGAAKITSCYKQRHAVHYPIGKFTRHTQTT